MWKWKIMTVEGNFHCHSTKNFVSYEIDFIKSILPEAFSKKFQIRALSFQLDFAIEYFPRIFHFKCLLAGWNKRFLDRFRNWMKWENWKSFRKVDGIYQASSFKDKKRIMIIEQFAKSWWKKLQNNWFFPSNWKLGHWRLKTTCCHTKYNEISERKSGLYCWNLFPN